MTLRCKKLFPSARRRWYTNAARLCLCLVAMLGVTSAERAAAAGAADTYRWHGELVAQDDHTVTIKSRIVSQTGLSEIDGLRNGDAIVITWSGFGDRANGIRFVQAIRPPADRFQLRAEFLGVDAESRYMTFRVTIPNGQRATARVFRPGVWTTLTSAHVSKAEGEAVQDIVRFVARDDHELAGNDTYRWNAEFVSRDDASSTVTLRARVVSGDAVSRLRYLTHGEPIVITWSGFGDRAYGIRGIRRDHSRLDDRFRLPAEFVTADLETGYLTFRLPKPAVGVAAIQGLSRGDWATVTSSHQPSERDDAVLRVDAFDVTRQITPVGVTAAVAPPGNYRWHAELVALDRPGQTMTVRARVVSPSGEANLGRFEHDDPIVVTWSGVGSRAHGIRLVEPASQVASEDGGFRLPARFASFDPETRYLTFSVTTTAGSLITASTLEPGDWATVTSPHRQAEDVVLLVDAYDVSRRVKRYTWQGELVAFDAEAAAVAFAAPVERHVLRYVDRFNEGDEVVLVWTPETSDVVSAVRYIEHREHSVLDHGYVLPVEFASADPDEQRIVFRAKVSPSMLSSWASLAPGSPVAVTSLFQQTGETAAIFTE